MVATSGAPIRVDTLVRGRYGPATFTAEEEDHGLATTCHITGDWLPFAVPRDGRVRANQSRDAARQGHRRTGRRPAGRHRDRAADGNEHQADGRDQRDGPVLPAES